MHLIHTKYRRTEVPVGKARSLDGPEKAITVVSGAAWLTVGGGDIILYRGDTAEWDDGAGRAVISPLGNQPLIYDSFASESGPGRGLHIQITRLLGRQVVPK